MTFNDLGLSEEIINAVSDLGFKDCMPVQEQAIPVMMYNDINLIALAQTGTGKTAAFGLPIIDRILKTKKAENNLSDKPSKKPSALILCPTRELCIQITNDLKKYSKYISLNIVAIYGGASIELQIKELNKGVDIVCSTPGRLIDIMDRKKLDISSIKYMVLDEADEMLNMGFKDDLDNIFQRTPQQNNIYLFSATMPKEVEQIANNYISNPTRIQIGERNQGSENVEHHYYLVRQKDRYLCLKRIADYYPDIYAIIFCRTKVETQEVADMLIKDGYNADSLHGDLSQAQRDHVMSRFRLRNIQMLVATDVAARGLDVHNLTHVINYELPDELEQYVHRSGRTGRADKQGISISIINLKQKSKIKQLEKIVKKDFIQNRIPTAKDVVKKQLFHLIQRVENADVENEEIDNFILEISKRLSWMDRESLIKHFVSLEFEDLLKYYKDAVDLNIDEATEKEKQRREEKKRNNTRGARQRDFDKNNFTKLFINVGHKDRIVPQRIIGMINDYTPNRRIEVGKIDIFDKFSYIEVSTDGANDVIDALNGRIIRGREMRVDIAEKDIKKEKDKNKRQNNKEQNKRRERRK